MENLNLARTRNIFTNRPRHWLIALSLGLLIGLTVADGIFAFITIHGRDAIQRQVDLSGEANLATVLTSAIEVMTGIVAIMLAGLLRDEGRASRAAISGWCGIGAIFLGFGLFDGIGFPAGLQVPVEIAGAVIVVVVFLLCYRQLPPARLIRHLMLLGCFLFILNPVFERLETGMMSNPNNYHFVASDQPYQFNADAWRYLWGISRSQEVTETGSAICLLAASLMYGERIVGDNAARVKRARIPNGD